MSARKASEDATPEAAANQWHLTHIQLVNWGTFCGYQHLKIRDRDGNPARVSMITGESGTGKSTLFDAKTAVLMRGTARFNTASNQTTGRARGSRERNVWSYVMGKQDDEYDPITGEARESHLRSTATANWSAIFITFVSDAGETYCAGRLYYVSAHATGIPDTFYLTADEDLDPRAMTGHARQKFTRGSIRTAYPEATTFESQEAFLRSVWRHLGIGRDGDGDSAMKLQERIQAGTTITDVDALFKDLVIDEPSTYDMAREATESFREHEATWEEMDRSRRKTEDLASIRETHAKIEELQTGIALLESCRANNEAPQALFLSRRAQEVFGRLAAECEGRMAALDERICAKEAEASSEQATLERLRDEVAGRGGDAIDRLRQKADDERGAIRGIRDTRTRISGFLADIGRTVPAERAAFEALRDESEAFLSTFAERRDALDERRLQARVEERELTERESDLSSQLSFYRQHPSNITPRMARDRQLISQATGIPESDLPYAAELMDVGEGEDSWRIAANVGFYSLASVLLVDRARIDQFSVRLNSLRLDHRVSYQGVRKRPFRQVREDPSRLSSKVVFREESPFAAYVSEWVHDTAHDYTCVDTPHELSGRGQRITREGQTRNRERGAHGFAKSSLIIGFSNADRIAEIEAELSSVRGRLKQLKAEIGEAQAAIVALERRRDAAMQVVHLRWEELDEATHTAALEKLLADISALERDTELAQLIAERDAAAARVRAIDQELGALRHQMAQEQVQAAAAAGAREQRLEEASRLEGEGVTLTKAQEQTLAQIVENIEAPLVSEGDSSLIARRYGDGQIAVSVRRSIAKRVSNDSQTFEERRRELEKVFEHYRRQWLDYDDPIGIDLESYPDYLRILEELEAEQLDLHIDDWLLDTLRRTGAALAPLARAYTMDRREIDRRMEPINQIMGGFKFGPDEGQLKIVVADRSPKAIRDFRQELSQWARLATTPSIEDADRLHLRLRDFMKSLEEATERHARGPLNTKSLVYITVVAHYPDRDDLPDKAYSSLGAKSGGETQELIAFILGAALLFCLGDNGKSLPAFAPVFLDEAFIKADERFTRRAIEALVGLGFQVIIAVPTSKVQAVEPVASQYVCITKDPVTNHSFVSEMVGERLDA